MRLRSLLLGASIALAAVSAHAQVPGYPAFFPPLTSGNCVQANSPFQATTTAAPCGVGTVSAGLINQMAWYAASGNAISGLATGNSGVLVTSAGGVPSISSTIPSATQDNITRTGTLVSGATGAGYTLALGSSTITGLLTGTNGGTGVNNGASTITLGGSLTLSGAFTTALTVTGNTALTLPTSGTVTALGNAVTGSGSIVLATSPTFVTNITTPRVQSASGALALSSGDGTAAPSITVAPFGNGIQFANASGGGQTSLFLVLSNNGLGTNLKNWETTIDTSGNLTVGAITDSLISGATTAYTIGRGTTYNVASHTWYTSTVAGTPVQSMQLTTSLWALPSAITAQFGTFSGSTCTNNGSITINDAGGTARKVMICS